MNTIQQSDKKVLRATRIPVALDDRLNAAVTTLKGINRQWTLEKIWEFALTRYLDDLSLHGKLPQLPKEQQHG